VSVASLGLAGIVLAAAGSSAPAGESSSGLTMRQGVSSSYHFAGTSRADQFFLTVSPAGRFILESRRPLTPLDPPNGCVVNSTFKVSCDRGLVKRVFVRLKRGRDKLIADDRFRLHVRALGGHGPDRMLGGTKGDTLRGGRGPDRLLGNRGSDTLMGKPGRDLLDGGSGFDRIVGGPGRDIVQNSPGNDSVDR
jgi:serralysin